MMDYKIEAEAGRIGRIAASPKRNAIVYRKAKGVKSTAL
jgi:hypothetical protein